MTEFTTLAFSYPTAVLSTLLLVVVVYWLLAMIGLIDFETSGIDIDLDLDLERQLDGDAGDIGVLASYVVAFGLNGVPFSVVVSLLVLISWTLTALFAEWILPWVPTTLLRIAAGTVGMLGAFAFSIPLTAHLVRPMRRLFVTHNARSNASLVGQTCTVLTGSVDEQFGRAEVSTLGAPLNIRVWAQTPNTFKKGDVALILEYDSDNGRYLIDTQP